MKPRLLDLADGELIRRRFGRLKNAHWPTDASVEKKGVMGKKETIGRCLRSLYFKWKGEKESNPPNARAQRIFSMGSGVERDEIEIHKRLGIWFDDHVKFFNKDLNLSGEIDEIVYESTKERGRLKPKLIFVEFKTTHGYFSEKQILGSSSQKGEPKVDHVLQLALYLYSYPDIAYGKLLYIFRDTAKRNEFCVEVKYNEERKKHEILVDGSDQLFCDHHFLPDYEKIDIEDIIARYKKLERLLKKEEPPEREYCMQYDDDQMRSLYERDKLSRKDRSSYERGNFFRKGSWRCLYCSHKDLCWEGDF